MVSINAAVNPILYWLFMPSFRQAVLNTFVPSGVKNIGETDRDSSQGSTTLSTVARA